jgi:hypothetical protein
MRWPADPVQHRFTSWRVHLGAVATVLEGGRGDALPLCLGLRLGSLCVGGSSCDGLPRPFFFRVRPIRSTVCMPHRAPTTSRWRSLPPAVAVKQQPQYIRHEFAARAACTRVAPRPRSGQISRRSCQCQRLRVDMVGSVTRGRPARPWRRVVACGHRPTLRGCGRCRWPRSRRGARRRHPHRRARRPRR